MLKMLFLLPFKTIAVLFCAIALFVLSEIACPTHEIAENRKNMDTFINNHISEAMMAGHRHTLPTQTH